MTEVKENWKVEIVYQEPYIDGYFYITSQEELDKLITALEIGKKGLEVLKGALP